jgi:leucyl aminopeptidase
VKNDVLTTLPAELPEALALHRVAEGDYAAWRDAQDETTRLWLRSTAFAPERGRTLILPGKDGRAAGALAGLGSSRMDAYSWHWLAAGLADRLPAGNYRLAEPLPAGVAEPFAVGWGIGSYRFQRYRNATGSDRARLLRPREVDSGRLSAALRANTLARDLINTPANDLGPAELAAAAQDLAAGYGGDCTVTSGELLEKQFPLVAAVGRGSPRVPRLIDLRFARAGAPRVTLVGKGVCFDSGGLDIKASSGMLLMKKDMGGAACALATALMLRETGVPVDLRVLVPAVENSVDGLSFRPGDVWASRKGLSVEIGNTDAEGRLVLADALAAAGEESPDLTIDFATLTGAARVALGGDLPAAYSGDDQLLEQLVTAGRDNADPLWPMPLWDGYEDELCSRVADLNNAPASGFAGSVTAALFLRRFVADPRRWVHLDIYGWNAKDRPGRPMGAEAHCVRAVTGLIRQRYA